mmetsp:Transcript_7146/g.13215  ORF Transcript_7146/g.13215 Transcript_7146/m.13215 type:complete len:142 (+) Transcript_7146:225-650(+)
MPWVQEHQDNSTETTVVSTSSSSPVMSSGPQHLEELPSQLFNNTGLPASFFTQQFPLNLEPTALPPSAKLPSLEDDLLSGFGDKHFHCVQEQNCSSITNSMDELLSNEADSFFDDFDFPDDIGNEIEDDQVFGDLLEQMIA